MKDFILVLKKGTTIIRMSSAQGNLLAIIIMVHLTSTAYCQDICSNTNPGGAICSCAKTSSTFSYDCRAKQISTVPVGINSSATTVNLSNNNITRLYQGSLNDLRKLKLLYLQANSITYIQPGTFNGMMSLTQLILTSNMITEIERGLFDHLPALAVLDLSQNRIKTINRYAFFTLPSLYLLNLEVNNLQCGCEEKLLQEYFEQRGSGLIVTNAMCLNFNAELSKVPKSSFPACAGGIEERLFQTNMACYGCAGASGPLDCANNPIRTCSGNTAVCYTRMDYYFPGYLSVTGGCVDYQTCLNQEIRNKDTCMELGSSTGTSCYFCNPDRLSNYKDVVNTTKDFDLNVFITLATDMTPQLEDTSSSEYKTFTMNLQQEVQNYIQNQKGAFKTDFLGLRSPRVTIAFLVHCSTMWFNSKYDVIQALTTALATRRFNGIMVEGINMYTIGKAQCKTETLTDPKYGSFLWPPADPGSIAFVECPYQLSSSSVKKYASRDCKRQSDNTGVWEAPLLADCPYADEEARNLHNLANTVVDENNVEDVSSNLSDLSSRWSEFETSQVDWTVSVIDDILDTDKSATSKDVITNTIDSVNNVLFINEDVLTGAENEFQTSNRLVAAVDRLLNKVDVSNGDVKVQKDNIAGLVTGVTGTAFTGLAMSYIHDGEDALTDTEITLSKSADVPEDGKSGIILPSSLFQSLSTFKRSSVGKVSLSVYRNAKLFSTITQTNETKQITKGDDVVTVERKVNSHVIAATVPNQVIKDLKAPVVVTLHHFNQGENASCVYWDTGAGLWSISGCVVNYTTDSYTICHCDHLTNFALLMDVYGSGGSIGKLNALVLSIISYIGCGLSLFGVLCTLFTYVKFRKLRRDNPSKILMNLCVAIGMVDIIFLVGVQPYASSSDSGCKVVAVLLHYFLLSALCWMVVEAFYMYLALVKIFDTYIAHFQLKSALFGWGVPLAIVAVTLGVNKTDNYGLQPGGICWLFQIPFYGAFLGPVCLMLIVNSIIYVLVIRQIVTRSSKKLSKSDTSNTAVRLRGATGLLVLLGLTWVFAIFAVDDFGVVFHYLFAIFNSAQGFFIFIFYCCLKKEAQQCWRKSLPCFKSVYEQTTSSNTHSKDTSSTFDSNKTTKTNVQTKYDSNQSSVPARQPVDESQSATTAFRGRWQVQVADPEPKTFV